MSPILIGGDGSIQWEVDVKKGKAGRITSDSEIGPGHSHPGGKFKSKGASDTEPGQRFAITIKHPKDQNEREAFRQQLYDAWVASNSPTSARQATFSIPIEDEEYKGGKMGKTTDQIVVDWPE